MLDSLIEFLNANPDFLLISVFMVALCESLAVIGLIVPGVGLITAISILAGNTATPVLLLLSSAMLGAFIGDLLSFILGRYCQPHLTNIWPFTKHPNWINDGESFFKHHGGKSIFIGRFIGPIRPFIPMVAGMMKMNFHHFLILNGLSAVAWGVVYLLPGYYLGESLNLDWLFSWQGILILVIASLIAFAITLNIKKSTARKKTNNDL